MWLLFKQLGLVALVFAGLYALGVVINTYVPWIWLTYFFALLRSVVRPVNFIWDTSALFDVLGVAFSLLLGVWVYRGVIAVRNFFS